MEELDFWARYSPGLRALNQRHRESYIKYFRENRNARKRDDETGKWVDIFVFCSKSNSTERTCKYNSTLENRYMIEIDRSQNIKVFKYNKKQNKWKKI